MAEAEVKFTRSALVTIREETSKAGEAETGGTLFGVEAARGGFIVMEATGPGPQARASGLHFTPDHEFQMERIRDAEARGIYYLGEWHKHPSSFRRLSNGDLDAFRAIMKKNPQLERVLAVLSFLDDGDVNVGAYVLEKNGSIHLADGIGGFQA